MFIIDKRITSKVYLLILGTILSVFLLLPSVNNTQFIKSTITAKTVFFLWSLLLVGIFFFFFFFLSKNRTIHLKFSRIDIFLSIILIYIIVNRYLIQEIHGFSIRFIELLGLAVFYLVLRNIKNKDYIWVGLGILLSGIIQAVYGMLQLINFFPSINPNFIISGSFFNPGPYAGFLSAVWPLALGFYLYKDNILPKFCNNGNNFLWNKCKTVLLEYVPLIAMATIIIVLPSTHSRAAWVSLFFGSLPLLFYKYEILKKIKSIGNIRRKLLAAFVCLSLSIFLLGTYHFKKDSAEGRLLIWKVSTKIIQKEPVFGTGFDRFKAHYMNAQADYLDDKKTRKEGLLADNNSYAFNGVLQFTIENGLIGLLIILLMVYSLINSALEKGKRHLKTICISVLLTVFIFGLFSYPEQILPIKLICITAVAFLAILDSKKWSERDRALTFKVNPASMILVLLVSGVLFWKTTSYLQELEQGFIGWKTAMNHYNSMKYNNSVKVFEKAPLIMRLEGDFLWNYGKALALNGEWAKAIDVLNRTKIYLNNSLLEITLGDAYRALNKYDDAEASYQRASKMVPNRFYPHYLLAKLYAESDNRYKAREKANEILRKEVKIPSKAIKQIQKEMRKLLEKPPGGLIE